MRKHIILFFSALLLLASCKGSLIGDDVIAKDKMVQMLTDIHIIDGSLTVYAANDSLYKYGTNRYALLFKKYGVDTAYFNKSLRHYIAKSDEIVAIYDSVNVVLKRKSDSIGRVQAKIIQLETRRMQAKTKAEQKRKADSLKRDSIRSSGKIKLKLKNGVI